MLEWQYIKDTDFPSRAPLKILSELAKIHRTRQHGNEPPNCAETNRLDPKLLTSGFCSKYTLKKGIDKCVVLKAHHALDSILGIRQSLRRLTDPLKKSYILFRGRCL